MRISDPMWRALEKMHRGNASVISPGGQSDYYVSYCTAHALAARGLAAFENRQGDKGLGQRTGGKYMPEYRMELTALGKTYCQRRFDQAET